MKRYGDKEPQHLWLGASIATSFLFWMNITPAHAQNVPLPPAEHASVAPRAMQAVAPALADYTDDILFGDIWNRPELSPRDRSIVTLSVLIATGKSAQLTGHLGRALDNGVRPGEIAGIVTHLAFYTGWPNAVSSLEVIEKVFADRKIDMAALRQPPALLPVCASDQVRARAVDAQIGPVALKLAELTNSVLFGDLWRRNDLSPRDRSLVTIAALAANGDDEQLAFHIGHGLENGLTRAQIGEAFTHLAFYAGWPKATAAVAVAGTVFAGGEKDINSLETLQLFPPGASPTAAPASNFTGSATVTSPFKAMDSAVSGATVTFRPGGHTNWHSHPRGQLLIITNGTGWVQAEGEPVRLVKTGDVVWTAPGVKHWHGATRTSAMTHVAVSESVDGKTVTWLEPVADYHGPASRNDGLARNGG
ncbi:MAG TPA: carboxymuconolactone decarboxylase family protein [Sphingobium sp.]|uniref:(R)-mandelonitrile lyase n=1 Tax=Sphingobium sp. TaxID=1912891 RepID=UPI002ECFD311